MIDIKYNLRKFDFPFCAREALNRIEQLISGRNVPSTKNLDLAIDLMREFIFCECDRRGNRTSELDPLQELQLLDVLCEYFSGPLNETAKNTIFLSLFGGPEAQRRMKFMCKLASMAISASIAPVLLAMGTWMQQTGCSSPASLQVAHSLVRDYFILHPTHEGPLKVLPTIAPQFVANFMTAVVEIYLKEGPGGTFSPPPKSLLEVITSWVCSNPKLCLSAQLNPTVLPNGGIPMAAVTPLAGLIQWCALAPLYITVPHSNDIDLADGTIPPLKKIKIEKGSDHTSASGNILEKATLNSQMELKLYGKLHLAVLQSLCEGRRPQSPSTVVSAQHLAQIVMPIQMKLLADTSKMGSVIQSQLQVCLDRLAQATQVALANGCVYGNIQNLLASFDKLPRNRMLSIVIKTHQQST